MGRNLNITKGVIKKATSVSYSKLSRWFRANVYAPGVWLQIEYDPLLKRWSVELWDVGNSEFIFTSRGVLDTALNRYIASSEYGLELLKMAREYKLERDAAKSEASNVGDEYEEIGKCE